MALEVKYLVAGKRITRIMRQLGSEDLWVDDEGTVYAMRADGETADPVDRCGVYPVALPASTPLDCAPHDYAYSSTAYQAFHTRQQADDYLRSLLGQAPGLWRLLAWPFYALSRLFGRIYWERDETND